MKVVVDTNVLLVAIPHRSKYRPIFDAYLNNTISLVVTTAIFFEYREILNNFSKTGVGDFIEESLLSAANVIVPQIYYQWDLIEADADDNKFTDAYLAADADYLITNDAHFNAVRDASFPPVKIVTSDEFLGILKSL